ncbi:MAG: peroxiredoxin [Sphaerobacteraceae bacterium]|nr:MAG: peroxiredoxin [Sphaerobacteraceae bacterium]
MTRSDNISEIPPDIPIPHDDGACDHLVGLILPRMALPTTNGSTITFAEIPARTVIYIYPRTGRPDQQLPTGWNDIPGARGCTPQSCSFRDHYAELQQLGVAVYGLSTQDTVYQREAVDRLQLPFPLVSDEDLAFASALDLPTFEVDGMHLIKRVTLICNEGWIEHAFYPVFPPHQSAEQVIEWLRENPV